MRLNQRNIFLLDGVGAVLSATGTGLVLPFFADWLGVSPTVLRLLGLQAALYAVYSLSCYRLFVKPKPGFLLGIILLNLLYCAIAVGFALFHPEITAWGRAFFIAETAIVFLVVAVEVRIYRASRF